MKVQDFLETDTSGHHAPLKQSKLEHLLLSLHARSSPPTPFFQLFFKYEFTGKEK